MARSSLQQYLPTVLSSCPVCLQRLGYPCRIGTGNLRHFRVVCHTLPSIHLLRRAFLGPVWFSPDKALLPIAFEEHWLGNAEWSYVYIRNPGNSVYLMVITRLLLQGNGLEHLPTIFLVTPNECQKTYSFHPEPTTVIHHLEKFFILSTSEEI
jgi:hypothetical protein